MEAKCDSSLAKGRQNTAVLSDSCEPSDRLGVLHKEITLPVGTAQEKCPKYCDLDKINKFNILCFPSSTKSLSLSPESKTDALRSANPWSWMATHPLAPSNFGEEEGAVNLICSPNWASGTL